MFNFVCYLPRYALDLLHIYLPILLLTYMLIQGTLKVLALVDDSIQYGDNIQFRS